MQTDNETKFSGFYAVLTQNGRKIAVKVVNEGTAQGGTIPVWKVRPLRYAGCVGWSGGCRAVHTLGTAIFVRKESVTGHWKTKHGALRNA